MNTEFQKIIDLTSEPRDTNEPCMPEEEYNAAIESISSEVKKAAAAYREKAEEAAAVLVQAKADYKKILEDAEKALIALDEYANVLQTKYPEDWERHALRYLAAPEKGYALILNDITEKGGVVNPITFNAWRFPDRIKK